jgi:hypothetical protein
MTPLVGLKPHPSSLHLVRYSELWPVVRWKTVLLALAQVGSREGKSVSPFLLHAG